MMHESLSMSQGFVPKIYLRKQPHGPYGKYVTLCLFRSPSKRTDNVVWQWFPR